MTITFQNDVEILSDILEMWYQDIQPIFNITDFLPALIFQPINRPVIENFAKNGEFLRYIRINTSANR